MKKLLFALSAVLLVFSTCGERKKLINSELQNLLAYYGDSTSDTYKQRAAQFLIDNMDAHYTLQSVGIDSFRLYMDSIFRLPYRDDKFYNRAYDTAIMRYGYLMEEAQVRIPDTTTVTADYLIANIDSAFRMWRTKWNMDYGFEHFCNYVLPYRVGHEPLSNWREKYIAQQYHKVKKVNESQKNHFYVYGVYSKVNKDIHAAVYYPKGFVPDFPATQLDSVRVGTCRTFTDLNIARFRSIGVPVAKDFVPQWGSRSMSHEWVVLLPNEELCYPFGPNEHLSDHFFGREDHTLPKVFRHMYAKQKPLLPLTSSGEPLPPLFESPTLMDVTDIYTSTTDATVRLFNIPVVKDSKYLYATVFDNRDWQIVHWGKRRGQQVTFDRLGRKVVYLPVAYTRHGESVPAGHPFLVAEDGTVQPIIADTAHRQTVRLTRKYRYTHWLKELCRRTEGGRFQVANWEDFSDSVTIATIGRVKESRFHTLSTTCDTTYRYFRYLSPKGSYGNMAEVEMYDSLGGRPIIKRMFGMRYAVGTSRLEKLFDGDVLTCYNRQFPDDGWAAVEFEEPQHISEVRFLPRNDDNFIREGEQYELYYWDGRRFASIARMEGNREGVLYVDNVPANALLLLRNHTKGKEERIFTYENGEQVWW
ncbi:MAG: transglutaminase domain-containing protein [Bacteroidales bacterium]|nr:transglutaminase domain-containing protein [Bacteroidales bacterium]